MACCVPALISEIACCGATVAVAVMVLPFRPNVTLFELLNTIFVRLLLVVPAEKFTEPPPPPGTTLAVMIPPADVPNVTLLALLKLSVWNVKEPLDADTA